MAWCCVVGDELAVEVEARQALPAPQASTQERPLRDRAGQGDIDDGLVVASEVPEARLRSREPPERGLEDTDEAAAVTASAFNIEKSEPVEPSYEASGKDLVKVFNDQRPSLIVEQRRHSQTGQHHASSSSSQRPAPEEAGGPPRPRGCCGRMLSDLLQQKEPATLLPYRYYVPLAQATCAGLCALILIAIGSGLRASSATAVELEPISYRDGDVEREFDISEQIDGEVRVYYELPGMFVNRKQFVESKDPDITYSMISSVSCSDAETQDEVLWRRGCDVEKRRRDGGPLECADDPAFAALINSLGTTEVFQPCGLVAMAMFTDEFEFSKRENSQWIPVNVSEADIALPHESGPDSKVYGSKIAPDGAGGLTITESGSRSWLRPGSFLEHFKVWYRVPPSPHVRNLWGRIQGPLYPGRYRVRFGQNSAVWTQRWGLREKRVALAGAYRFGSRGAAQLLGALCLALGLTEAILVFVFVAIRARTKW